MSEDRTAPIFYCRSIPQGKKGEPIDLSGVIIDWAYEDEEAKADKLTLKVDNFNLEQFDEPHWKKGGILEVQWGYPGNMSPARQCVIQSVKGFQVLAIEALDKGIVMNKDTKSRTFDQVKRSDVVRTIAKENGYDAERVHVEETAVVYDHIVQARTTDAQFMKLLAGKEGFEFFVDFDGLHWHRKKIGQKPVREFIWYTDPGRGDVLDIDIDSDVTAKPAAVTAAGRDPLKKETFKVTGSDADTKRAGNAPVLEAINPRTGETHNTEIKATGSANTIPTTEPNAAGAKAKVDGAFRQSQITVVQLTMKVVGDPQLLAKTMVKISGIRSLSGNYYVSSVKHNGGPTYVCEMKCKRDGRSSAAGTAKPAESKASLNDQAAKKDDGSLAPVEKVNGRTGETSFVDTRGRSTSK